MNLSRSILAGTLLAVLPLGSALACTTSAWTGTNKTATDANSGGPTNNIARYSGLCALRATASNIFVADNSPAGPTETTYAVRFYVHTGLTSGNAKIFSATTGDNGTGSETIGVTYNHANNFDFSINGASIGTVTGIQQNKWYSIDFIYKSGTSFNVDVAGAGGSPTGFNQNLTVNGIAAGSVGSATLGFISGSGVGALNFDEFDSSRADAKIGRLARGNARAEDPVVYDVFDIIDTAREVQSGPAVHTNAGQPDATEDGIMDVFDIISVARRVQLGNF